MKRLPILSKMFLVLFFFAIALSAFNAGSTIGDTLIIPYTLTEPVIDGATDANVWDKFPQVGMFVYTMLPDTGGASNLSAWYKMVWSDFGMFWFVHVVDDTIIPFDPESWERDCIELFIDGHNDKAATYDSNDVQWRATALGNTVDSVTQYSDSLTPCWNGGINLIPPFYTLAWTENADGYDMELAVPDSGLKKQLNADGTILSPQIFDLIPGTVIGWEIHISDDDSLGGGSDNGERWWSDQNPYEDPSTMGTAILGGYMEGSLQAVLGIPTKNGALTVDGFADEWLDTVPEVAMSVGGTVSAGGQDDFASWFRVATNASGDLYFFSRVLDDSIAMGTEDWNSDNIEIYIDGDNSKAAGAFDNYDDVQYRFVYGQDSASFGPGPSECDVAWVQTIDGYDMELVIPAATLADTNITLDDGDIIGFEVQVSDNDGSPVGDGREAINKWWNPSNDSYLYPILWGTAIIGVAQTEVTEAPAVLSVPAVISGSSLDVEGSGTVSVVNLVGQVVASGEADGALSIDVSGLVNGVYLVILNAGGNTSTAKTLLIK